MAVAVLTPRVRIMAICDRARESKTEANVYDLKGVRQTITADFFPFVPSRLWLFVILSNARGGEFPGYLRLVNDKTDRVVWHGHLTPRPSFDPDGGLWAICYPIRCRFAEPGNYSAQVWFFQDQGSDVLKGELPFVVLTEDTGL